MIPSPHTSSLRSLPRNVWIVTLTSFLNDVSSEMILTMLPLFLANVLGVGTSVIGLIEGVAESISSLLKVYFGWLSDRLGSRKGLTVFGYGLSTVAKPFLAITTSWAGVLAVRLADRIGKGVRAAPRDALIADTIDERRRGLAFGLHRAGDTAGALVGILLAMGVVWATQSAAPLLAARTFRTLALIGAIPAALAVLILALFAQDVPVAVSQSNRRFLPTLSGLGGQFRRFLLVVILFTLGNSADAFVILRAQERGLSVLGILAMLATFNLVYAAFSGPAGALSDRLGRRRLIVAGWTLYGLLYLGYAVVDAAWQVWLLYALYGLYYAAFEGAARAMVADLVDPAQRGAAYGAYNAAVGLATLPASVIAGLLWQGVGGWAGLGPGAPFAFGAGLALIAALLLIAWVPRAT